MSFLDGILDRITTEQLVLPNKLVPLVFAELHVNMGDLGKKQTLQLILDRLHWPKMEYNVTHYVTKVCSCVKRRKPHSFCCTHTVAFFSSTIKVNWFRLLPS